MPLPLPRPPPHSQAAAASPAFHRLQQHQQPPAPSGIPKPRRSDPAPDSPPSGSPASSPGTSPRTSGGLDQFAPMLSSNPLQQLPLLPAAASIPSADMVRVAAWLLDQAGEQEGPAGAGASAANDLAANSPTEGQGWGQGRGGADCEGFRATGYFEEARRRSLDSVVRPHLAGQQVRRHGVSIGLLVLAGCCC